MPNPESNKNKPTAEPSPAQENTLATKARVWNWYRKWILNLKLVLTVAVLFGALLLYQGIHIYQEQNAINQLKSSGFIVTTHRTPGRLIIELLGYEIRGKRPTTYAVKDKDKQNAPHTKEQLQQLAKSLSSLSHPTNLHLKRKITVSSLTMFSIVAKLKNLELRDCPELKTLEGLQNNSQLQSLRLTNCRQLRNLDALASLTNLQDLFLQHADELTSMQGLAGCINLRGIGIDHCPNLQSLSVISQLPSLETLYLSGKGDQLPANRNIKKLDFIPEASKLRDINLMDFPLVDDFTGLERTTYLIRLLVSGNENIRSLDEFPELRKLDTLQLNSFSRLISLGDGTKFPALGVLHVTGCTELNKLPPLHEMNSLRRVNLSGSSVSPAEIKKLQTTATVSTNFRLSIHLRYQFQTRALVARVFS